MRVQPSQNDGYHISPANDYFTTDAATNHGKRAAVIMLLVGGLAFGSFLWLRMRLVTDMPRQAYADPDSARAQHAPDATTTDPLAPDTQRNVIDLDPRPNPRLDPDPAADHAQPYSVNDARSGHN